MPPKPISQNTLFYGDNLPVLREYIPSESIDLVYLDPPFNSNRSYNVLFKDESGKAAEAQISAFDDTWHWGESAEKAYHDLMITNPGRVDDMVAAIRQIIGTNQMMAYLVMMAERLVELHRILKPTGSLYLHCDPTASHYLKIMLDTVFSPENFVSELIWRRQNAKGLAFTRFASNHDILLMYQKSNQRVWHAQYKAHDPQYIKNFYRFIEPETGRRYRLADLTNPNKDRPNLTYEFLGVTRVWRWTKERMADAYEKGLVLQSKPGGVPQLKRYLDEQEGTPIDDIWDDVMPIQAQAAERLGYPTQKPISLLERIIQASSSLGDVVLDPFCGCGTAIAAAEKLGRKWIGIDITHLAISLIKYRMKDMFPSCHFEVIGEPKDIGAARQLAHDNRYQFQWWALSLVRARPVGGDPSSKTGKKGSDLGIDGVINFIDDNSSLPKRVIVQVKSGHVKSGDIRDLRGVVDREKAAIGVFLTLESPSSDMLKESATCGYYSSDFWQKTYPKIQILTIGELLRGSEVKMPPNFGTFKQASKIQKAEEKQPKFDL